MLYNDIVRHIFQTEGKRFNRAYVEKFRVETVHLVCENIKCDAARACIKHIRYDMLPICMHIAMRRFTLCGKTSTADHIIKTFFRIQRYKIPTGKCCLGMRFGSGSYGIFHNIHSKIPKRHSALQRIRVHAAVTAAYIKHCRLIYSSTRIKTKNFIDMPPARMQPFSVAAPRSALYCRAVFIEI